MVWIFHQTKRISPTFFVASPENTHRASRYFFTPHRNWVDDIPNERLIEKKFRKLFKLNFQAQKVECRVWEKEK